MLNVEMVAVFYAGSSLEPKLELSYPPSGDLGTCSAYRLPQSIQRLRSAALRVPFVFLTASGLEISFSDRY